MKTILFDKVKRICVRTKLRGSRATRHFLPESIVLPFVVSGVILVKGRLYKRLLFCWPCWMNIEVDTMVLTVEECAAN